MRKEADDVGPQAELEHWKKRMAKFDSLISCLKGSECRTVLNVLQAAKSKVMEVRKGIEPGFLMYAPCDHSRGGSWI